ncbi:cysteine desulfurase family protein [Blattabacterium cuenoti]|uniref:cysteine desulfurase family protein n=1 Tax=Blattabacterium cuenoti TaxID=1653831 RepID=UPI00163B9379|nr:cysteine desulfurase family protein [Blattabacterium cuenoti]
MKRVYLDNAATTPMKNEVIKVMINSLKYSFGNPSSIQHSDGRKSRSLIEESRIFIANCINAFPEEIIFTSGGTEANNMILRSSVFDLGVEHIITSKLEHLSVLQPIHDLSYKHKISIHFVQFNSQGVHDINHVEFLLKKYKQKKMMVSLMYANNEIGNILEVNNISFLCKKYNAYFHSDTIQFIGNYPLDIKKLSFDFATASAHKFYGPKGIGFVFIKKSLLVKIKGSILGGLQEKGLRSGTENISGIAGISEAFRLFQTNHFHHIDQLKKLKKYCIQQLIKMNKNILFNGLSDHYEKSIPSIINFLFPVKKIDNLFYFRLDLMGISVSNGSSCNSGNTKEISHVIRSIVKNSILKKTMPIRISFGIFNKNEDIDMLIHSLNEIGKYKNIL